jgi:hypothetical protein
VGGAGFEPATFFTSDADMVAALQSAHLEGTAQYKLRTYSGPLVLMIDELRYLPAQVREPALAYADSKTRLEIAEAAPSARLRARQAGRLRQASGVMVRRTGTGSPTALAPRVKRESARARSAQLGASSGASMPGSTASKPALTVSSDQPGALEHEARAPAEREAWWRW